MADLRAIRGDASDPALIAFTGQRSKDMAGRDGTWHLSARPCVVVAALSTPRPRNAAGASRRRGYRPGGIASSVLEHRTLSGRRPTHDTPAPASSVLSALPYA